MQNMRRKDREKPRDFALAVVDKSAFFTMATVNTDGTPYCVTLSMAREGEWLYFHSAREGQKIANLKLRNKVCVSCVGDQSPVPGELSINYESTVINGTAFEVTDREEKIRALYLISMRHAPKSMVIFEDEIKKALNFTAVWKIHIDEISGKGK